MATVKITRIHARFRRSINGAWLGNGHDVEDFEGDEDRALSVVLNIGLTGSVSLLWPDGRTEWFNHGSGFDLKGPSDSRLLPEEVRRPEGTWFPQRRELLHRLADGSYNWIKSIEYRRV